jgi:hypothetical protein
LVISGDKFTMGRMQWKDISVAVLL